MAMGCDLTASSSGSMTKVSVLSYIARLTESATSGSVARNSRRLEVIGSDVAGGDQDCVQSRVVTPPGRGPCGISDDEKR